MADLTDHADLLVALGGGAEVAASFARVEAELRPLPVNVRAWSARNRIPPEYWPGVIAMSATRGFVVTADWLMRTTPARKNASPTAPAQAAA